MFFGFVKFYKQFIKNFYKIVVLLISILTIIALLASARPGCTRATKNKTNIKGDDSISSAKIDNRIANLSNSKKLKKNYKMNFLIFEASLAFTQLKKIIYLSFINPKHYSQIKTDASDYAIDRVLSLLTFKIGFIVQVIYKPNFDNLSFEISY